MSEAIRKGPGQGHESYSNPEKPANQAKESKKTSKFERLYEKTAEVTSRSAKKTLAALAFIAVGVGAAVGYNVIKDSYNSDASARPPKASAPAVPGPSPSVEAPSPNVSATPEQAPSPKPIEAPAIIGNQESDLVNSYGQLVSYFINAPDAIGVDTTQQLVNQVQNRGLIMDRKEVGHLVELRQKYSTYGSPVDLHLGTIIVLSGSKSDGSFTFEADSAYFADEKGQVAHDNFKITGILSLKEPSLDGQRKAGWALDSINYEPLAPTS